MAKIQIKNSFITSSAQITISSSLVRFSDNIRAKGITGSFSGSFAGSNLFVQGGNSFGTTALLGTNDNQPLVLETNASEKMRVTAAGLVGIGTSSPTQKLDIVGSYAAAGDSSGILKIRGGATGADTQLNFGVSADGGYGWIQGTDVGLTNNINIILNPIGGNVGIGTTSATSKLYVSAGTLALNQRAAYISADITTNTSTYTHTLNLIDGATDANPTSLALGTYSHVVFRNRAVTAGSVGGILDIYTRGVATDPTVKMTITDVGNVGIGTSSPTQKLEVIGAGLFGSHGAGTYSLAISNNDQTNARIRITNSGTGGRSFSIVSGNPGLSNAGFAIYDETSAATRMYISGSGNIGIGTTIPTGLLEVYASNNGGLGGFLVLNNNGNAIANETAIIFGDGVSTARRAAISSTTEDSPYYGDLKFKTGLSAYSSLTTRMIIKGAGNVGIGTTAPLSLLDVRSGYITAGSSASTNGSTILAGYYSNSAGILTVLGTEFSSGGPVLGYAVSPSTSGTGAFLSSTTITIPRSAYTQDGGTHRWFTGAAQSVAIGSAVTTSEKMRINSDGNLGIGTSNPVDKLDINGNLYFSKASDPRIYAGSGVGLNIDGQALWLNRNTNASIIMVTGGGNVGIGTTSPSYKLDVVGTIAYTPSVGNPILISNDATYGTSGTGRYVAVGFGGLANSANKIFAHNTGEDGIYICSATSRNINFRAGGGATDHVTIKSDGNVGINTTSPASRLQLGNLSSTQTSVPETLSLGGTYSNSAGANVKLRVYEDGGGGAIGGMSVSSGQMEVNTWSAGKIAFYRGTTQSAIIDANGNLGIGTSSPTAKLDVTGDIKVGSGTTSTTKVTGSLHVTGSITLNTSRDSNWPFLISDPSTVGGSSRYQLGKVGAMGFNYADSYAQLQIIGSSGAYIDLGNSATDDLDARVIYFSNSRLQLEYGTQMAINSTGVGIGTTSPGSPLDVYSNTNGQASIYVRNPSTGTAAYAGLAIGNNNGSNSGGIVVFGSNWNTAGLYNPNGTYVYSNQGGGLVLASEAVAPIIFGTSNTERMRILSNGNVGIGSSSPPTMLQVVGTGVASVGTINIRGSQAHLGLTTAGGTFKGWYGYFNSSTHGSDLDLNIKTGYAGASNIRIAANGDATQLFISGSGNVGIGTTSPSIKLAVDGEASFGDGSKLTLIGLDINSQVTPNFIKIRTKIPFASGAADFTINIKGFRYGSAETTSLMICWHYYLSTFYSPTISSAGSYAPTVKLSAEDWDSSGTPKVCIVLVSPGYWPKLYVESMYSSAYNDAYADGWDWVDADATGTGNNLAILSYKSNFGNSFVMLSNGSVGIGTVSPAYKLDVNGTGYFSSTLQVNSNITLSGGGDVIINDSDGTGFFASYMDSGVGYIRIDDGGTANGSLNINNGRLFVGPSTGNVGIGTTSPASLLQVGGSSGATATPTAIQMDNTFRNAVGGNTSLKFYLYRNTANSETYGFGLNNAGGIEYHAGNSGGTAANHAFYTETTEKMRLNSSGNLGIGTTSPAQKLHVVGAVYGTTYGQFGTSVASGTNSSYAVFGSNSAVVGVKINIDSNVNRNDLVVSGSTGNVGIGTSRVLSKLNAYASGSNLSVFRVDGGNGTLFEVTDQLSGSLFSVNDVSGLPLLEVFSNNRVVAGKYGTNALVVSGSSVGIGTSRPAYRLQVSGSFAATTKSFVINHPDPAKSDKQLVHGVTEGPEHTVFVRGKLLNDNIIQLPDYWQHLVHEESITVTLTPNKYYQQLYVKNVTDTTIEVGSETDKPINCYYYIVGERKDIPKLITEI